MGVFYDDNAVTVEDPDHYREQRFITLGMDFKLQVLVVVNAQRSGNTIRVISARKANGKERQQYKGNSA